MVEALPHVVGQPGAANPEYLWKKNAPGLLGPARESLRLLPIPVWRTPPRNRPLLTIAAGLRVVQFRRSEYTHDHHPYEHHPHELTRCSRHVDLQPVVLQKLLARPLGKRNQMSPSSPTLMPQAS